MKFHTLLNQLFKATTAVAFMVLMTGIGFSAQIVGVYSGFDSLNDADFDSVSYNINTLGDAPGNPGNDPDMEWSLTTGQLQDYGGNSFGTFTAFNGDDFAETDTLTFRGDSTDGILTGGQFQITLDLTGIEDIKADFTFTMQQLTPAEFTSATEVELEYSTGGAFTSFGTGDSSSNFPANDGDAELFSYDLSSITAIEDADDVTLRFNLPDFDGSQTNPHLRIDNLQVYGSVIPEPSAGALLLSAAGLMLAFRRRRG